MNKYKYIKCFWKYIDDTPILLFYEIDLENERYAIRMTEVFSDKRATPFIEKGFDYVTEAPVPTIYEINKDAYAAARTAAARSFDRTLPLK